MQPHRQAGSAIRDRKRLQFAQFMQTGADDDGEVEF